MTFSYLAAFNWWLVLCPWTLSHDWQLGSVPLLTSAADPRHALTLLALAALLALAYCAIADVEVKFIIYLLLCLMLPLSMRLHRLIILRVLRRV